VKHLALTFLDKCIECGNGICSGNGTCACDVGYKGATCNQEVDIGMIIIYYLGTDTRN